MLPKKAAKKKTAPHAAQKKKILIVEDEQPILTTLELKLRSCGFDTACATNGEQALASLRGNGCDLILLDLVMPVMDGFEVLRRLQAMERVPPVFVITNLGQEEDCRRCKELGAQDYFVKADVPIIEIVERIKRYFV